MIDVGDVCKVVCQLLVCRRIRQKWILDGHARFYTGRSTVAFWMELSPGSIGYTFSTIILKTGEGVGTLSGVEGGRRLLHPIHCRISSSIAITLTETSL